MQAIKVTLPRSTIPPSFSPSCMLLKRMTLKDETEQGGKIKEAKVQQHKGGLNVGNYRVLSSRFTSPPHKENEVFIEPRLVQVTVSDPG